MRAVFRQMKPTEGVCKECHCLVICLTSMLEFDLKSMVGLLISLSAERCCCLYAVEHWVFFESRWHNVVNSLIRENS